VIIYANDHDMIGRAGHVELRLLAEKAALLFADNGWTWYVDTDPPDADRICIHLISLMCDAVNEARRDGTWAKISSGRLYAEARKGPDGDYAMEFGITFPL
jgi:hypothetical protein